MLSMKIWSSPEFMHPLDWNWEALVAHWLDGQRTEREMIPQSGSEMYIHMLHTVVKYAHCHSFKLHWMCMKQKTALHKYPLDLIFNNHLHSPTKACLLFPSPVVLLSSCFRFPAWTVVSLSLSLSPSVSVSLSTLVFFDCSNINCIIHDGHAAAGEKENTPQFKEI